MYFKLFCNPINNMVVFHSPIIKNLQCVLTADILIGILQTSRAPRTTENEQTMLLWCLIGNILRAFSSFRNNLTHSARIVSGAVLGCHRVRLLVGTHRRGDRSTATIIYYYYYNKPEMVDFKEFREVTKRDLNAGPAVVYLRRNCTAR